MSFKKNPITATLSFGVVRMSVNPQSNLCFTTLFIKYLLIKENLIAKINKKSLKKLLTKNQIDPSLFFKTIVCF